MLGPRLKCFRWDLLLARQLGGPLPTESEAFVVCAPPKACLLLEDVRRDRAHVAPEPRSSQKDFTCKEFQYKSKIYYSISDDHSYFSAMGNFPGFAYLPVHLSEDRLYHNAQD